MTIIDFIERYLAGDLSIREQAMLHDLREIAVAGEKVGQAAAGADSSAAPADGDGWEWAIVEIMGHRRHAGRCREVERFGAKLLRIDVPTVEVSADKQVVVTGWETHFYSGQSMFSYTPASEAAVMQLNKKYAPPSPYRLPAPEPDDEADEADEAELVDEEVF